MKYGSRMVVLSTRVGTFSFMKWRWNKMKELTDNWANEWSAERKTRLKPKESNFEYNKSVLDLLERIVALHIQNYRINVIRLNWSVCDIAFLTKPRSFEFQNHARSTELSADFFFLRLKFKMSHRYRPISSNRVHWQKFIGIATLWSVNIRSL